MTIQQYSELIAQVAKIETLKGKFIEMKSKCDSISAQQAEAYHNNADKDMVYEINEKWLAAYEEREKMERKIKKEYKAFRAKIEGEFSYLAHEVRYSSDNSDGNFYWYVRFEILREGKNIEFTTGK